MLPTGSIFYAGIVIQAFASAGGGAMMGTLITLRILLCIYLLL